MPKPSFFAELKRRHVYRVAIAYAVTAWLLLQIGAIVFPALHAPKWCEAVLLAFLLLGFPMALLLVWAFEVTPEGVRRTEPAGSMEARRHAQGRRIGRRIDFAIIAVLAAAVGVLAWRLSVLPTAAERAAAASPGIAAAPATTMSVKSIAVLPFANDSGDPDQRYFSDGLSESLIIALSQYPALTVIGRESSFQLRDTKLDSRQIGKKLGVANLLEGSVSRDGGEVRVRAELVSAASGRTLWSDTYDRPYKNLFALQDNITNEVAMALDAKLLGGTAGGAVVQTDRPPSGSLAAYNAYLEGNFYYDLVTASSLHQAIAFYRRAIALDPKYAAAYAALAHAWARLGASGLLKAPDTERAYAKAQGAAGRALTLDPDLATAHEARGYVSYFTLDWRQAETEFRRGLALAPGSAQAKRELALVLATLGRLKEAIRLQRDALAANPLDTAGYYDLALYLSGVGQPAPAAQAMRRAMLLQPSYAGFHAVLAAIEIQRGDTRSALQAAETEQAPIWRPYALALAYAAAGDGARADAALQELTADYADDAAYRIARIYAFRDQPDEAFAWLDRAWRRRDSYIRDLLYDPFLLRYKNDPRFAAFCRKVGLPVPGSTAAAAGTSGDGGSR